MFDNDEAVEFGDGTIPDTTGLVYVDDGIGGFWKPAEEEEQPPPHPLIAAIMNARPPLMRIPLRARPTRRRVATRRPVVTRRAVATRTGRVTTARRIKRHKSSTRSVAGSSAGSDLSGDSPPGHPPRSLRIERKALRREGVARAVPAGTSVVVGRA